MNFEILPDEPQQDKAVNLALDRVARSRAVWQAKEARSARIQDNHRPQFRYLGEAAGQSVIQAAGGDAFVAGERITNGSMETGSIAPSYLPGVVRLGGMPRVLSGGTRQSQTVQAGVLVLRSRYIRTDVEVVTIDPVPARVRVAYSIDAVGTYEETLPNGDIVFYDTYGPGIAEGKPWSITAEPRYYDAETFWKSAFQCWIGLENWASAPPGNLRFPLNGDQDDRYGYYSTAGFFGGMVIFTEIEEGQPLPPLPYGGEISGGACTYPPTETPEPVWIKQSTWGYLETIVVQPAIPGSTETFYTPVYEWELLLVGAYAEPVTVMTLEPDQVDSLWARMAIDAGGIHVDVKLGNFGNWDELKHFTIAGNNITEIDESTNWRRFLANSNTNTPAEEPENKCISDWMNIQTSLNVDEAQNAVFRLDDPADEEKVGLDVVTMDDLKEGVTRTITQKAMQFDDESCLVNSESPVVATKAIALLPYDPELRTGEAGPGDVEINESASIIGIAGYIGPIKTVRTSS